MERRAWMMKLKPSYEVEYVKRHDEIWPELEKELRDMGMYDYSIFFDRQTNTLFAVQKLKPGHTADQAAYNPVVQKWWRYMADIMETHPDDSPVTEPLDEVFYMP